MNNPQPQSDQIKPGLPPAPAEPVARTEVAYCPLSGWAIAGFGAGALFALVVALATVTALAQGSPLFFPVWFVGLAVVGVVLSIMGQRHVQNSEGTRAGGKLARIGLWLSIVGGVCYLTYFFVTGLALQSQANAFLMEKTDDDSGFFPRLRDGQTDPVQYNAAFLLTLPGSQRSIRPDNDEALSKNYDTLSKDGMPGNLTQFKYGVAPGFNSTLGRLFFGKSAKDVEVIPMGVQDWKYEQKSYKVRRTYRLKTKEIEWDVTLTVASTEGETAGQGRKWFLNLAETNILAPPTVTPFGEGIAWLRSLAGEDLAARLNKLNRGAALANVAELDKTAWERKLGAEHAEKRKLLHELFQSNAKDRMEKVSMYLRGSVNGGWEEGAEGKIRIVHPFRFALPHTPGQPPYMVDAYAVLETVQPGNPIGFGRLSAPPDWELVQLVFFSIATPPENKGMMPGP